MSNTLRRITIEIIVAHMPTVDNIMSRMTKMISETPIDTYYEITVRPAETSEEAIKNIAEHQT